MAVHLVVAARKWAVALIVALSSLESTSFAAPVVSYTASNSSGNNWVYQYTVSNPAPPHPIAEFTIWFDRTRYSNLSVIDSPAEWDSIVIQSDESIPADGFFDSLALASGIGSSQSLSGFTVQFTFLAAGNPGAQPFDILDADFNTVFSGTTTRDPGPGGQVPEPGVISLILLGMSYFARASANRRSKRQRSASHSAQEVA